MLAPRFLPSGRLGRDLCTSYLLAAGGTFFGSPIGEGILVVSVANWVLTGAGGMPQNSRFESCLSDEFRFDNAKL